MLMSREELYNKITGSSAYNNKNAVLDSSKVNKSKYSPNNIKALLLGKNTAVVIYYTTNPTAPCLVRFMQLSQTYKNAEEYQEALKSKKGMIDVVEDGLKFSNLEEIFFFSEGFTPEELEKESCRIDLFAKDINKVQRSFKRLKYIALVPKGVITKDFENHLKNDKYILPQLEKGKYSIIPIATYKPENDEFGLLKNFERDSVQYAYDAEYDPNADPKERESGLCRLHKWYIDQIANAKRAQEKAKAEAEKDEVDEVAINLYLNKIMTVFRDLYKSCFGLKKPVGLLTPEGILYSSEGTTKVHKSDEYGKLYNLAVSSSSFGVQPSGQLQDIDVHDLYKVPLNGTYYPLFHLAVMQGRTPDWVFKSWDLTEKRKKNDNVIETTLEKEITKLIRAKLIETYKKGEDLAGITNKLCTSFVVTELAQAGDKSTLMIKLKLNAGNAKFNLDSFCNTFESAGDTYLAGGAKITQRVQKKTGVSQVSLCLNEELYQKMPLFAYEAVEHKKARGQKISIKNCIIGQTTDDEILTIDLTQNDSKILNILAGPRAGKGVLTLGLLGTILSDGCPLVYMDAKPDMSNVLNELANSKGIRVAAWDLNTPPLEYIKENPIMQSLSDAKIAKLQDLGKSAPVELSESTSNSTWGLLAYLKILQLTMVSAKMQKDKKIKTPGAGHTFFVLDELLRVYSELEVFYNILEGIIKDKNTEESLKTWCEKLMKWIETLGQDFTGSMVAEMPNSHTNIIALYQKASTWKYSGKKPSTQQAVFTPITAASNATKIVGGKNADSEGGYEGLYALGQQRKDLATKVTQYYHFGMFTGSRLNDASNCTVFKPYLVLNSAEMDSQYVSDMEKNIGPKAFEDLLAKGGGVVPSGVGFEGFMNTIGDEGIQNLSRGYEYLTEILKLSGLDKKYNSIEEYLYDADINSFYSKSVLIEGRAGEVAEANKPKSDSASSGSWNLGEESEDEEEINIFDEGNNSKVESSQRPQVQQTTNQTQVPTGPKPQPQQTQSSQYGQNQQQTARPQTQQKFSDIHREGQTLKFDHDPIIANRTFIKSIDAINAMKTITKYIFEDIKKFYGGVNAIKSFIITSEGILIFNEKAYAPKLDEKFINNFEDEDTKTKLREGYLADLFFIKEVFKFINLEHFEIEDEEYANDTVRLGLGIKGKSFTTLYDRFPKLKDIIINGIPYLRGNVISQKEQEFIKPRPRLSDLRNAASGINNYQVNPNTLMGKVWNSRPVKTLVCAAGWTMGAQIVFTAATLLGLPGLMFGAFALAKVYNDYKKEHPDPPKTEKSQSNRRDSNRTYQDDRHRNNESQGRPNNRGNNQKHQKQSNYSKNERNHNNLYK